MITFLWAKLLWLLLGVPLLIGAYVGLLRRSRRTVRYSSVALMREAMSAELGLAAAKTATIFFAARMTAQTSCTAAPVAIDYLATAETIRWRAAPATPRHRTSVR